MMLVRAGECLAILIAVEKLALFGKATTAVTGAILILSAPRVSLQDREQPRTPLRKVGQ
jgi:hypothetical protein